VIVVDANIVVYLLTMSDRTEDARRLWSTDGDWRAPRLLVYELANVFARLVRAGALSLEDGMAGLEAGARLVAVTEQEPSPSRILEIASKLDLSAYDATYLALAERLGVPMFTEDARLLRAAPAIARSPALTT
jgi:predicted nucleic acid-binding protein